MQSINYNYGECITNLDLTTSFDLWKEPHLDKLDDIIQSIINHFLRNISTLKYSVH